LPEDSDMRPQDFELHSHVCLARASQHIRKGGFSSHVTSSARNSVAHLIRVLDMRLCNFQVRFPLKVTTSTTSSRAPSPSQSQTHDDRNVRSHHSQPHRSPTARVPQWPEQCLERRQRHRITTIPILSTSLRQLQPLHQKLSRRSRTHRQRRSGSSATRARCS